MHVQMNVSMRKGIFARVTEGVIHGVYNGVTQLSFGVIW